MRAWLTDEAAGVAIDVATRTLHLPTVRSSAVELATAAVRDRLTHLGYLAELLSVEVEDREARRRERRITEARFPRTKRLAEFDLDAAPSIEGAALAALAAGAWIAAGEPVVLLGDSGTGKSHCETVRLEARSTAGPGAQTGAGSGGDDPKVSLAAG